MACPLAELLAVLLPPGVLWHRRRGRRRWVRRGTYASVAAAVAAMEAARARGVTGNWYAAREGMHPDDKDTDEDET